MTDRTLDAAIAEAERFLAAARRLRERELSRGRDDGRLIWASKESGACRRASMDLTRALADLRQRY
jgi:hypothetical protein